MSNEEHGPGEETWDDIMAREAGGGERPRPLPIGTYRLELTKWTKRSAKVTNRETGQIDVVPILEVRFTPIEAQGDVPVEELEGLVIEQKRIKYDFWMRSNSLFKLDDFLAQVMGFGAPLVGTYEELLDQAVGRECLGYVTQRNDDVSGEPRYNDIDTLTSIAA